MIKFLKIFEHCYAAVPEWQKYVPMEEYVPKKCSNVPI